MSASQGQITDPSSNDLPLDPSVPRPSSPTTSRGGRPVRDGHQRRSSAQEDTDMRGEPSYRQILPPQPPRQYSHLPTPQSPNNLAQYAPRAMYQPDSPLNHGPLPMPLSSSSISSQRGMMGHSKEHEDVATTHSAHGFITPESSPLIQRNTLPRISELNLDIGVSTPRSSSYIPHTPPYPRSAAPVNRYNSPVSHQAPIGLAPAPDILPSRDATPSASADISTRSTLSSPFMSRMSVTDRHSNARTPRQCLVHSPPPPPSQPAQSGDLFSTSQYSSAHTPPVSPPLPPAGGEIDRIHQAMRAQAQEAETRRPDYLKRVKRSISEVEAPELEEERHAGVGIGITESPLKGRRLKLFQETSEESFEESLMAGGYGRYRTAEWVRQPQPLPSPQLAGPSNVVPLLEQEAEPTQKELQKKRRLDAFRGERPAVPKAKLLTVEVEGRGRIIMEASAEDSIPPPPEPSPSKKRSNARRKKKGTADQDIALKVELATVLGKSQEGRAAEGPNWPDTEFPWKLRTDERSQLKHLEEEERLKWIERFLDRDSDEEEEDGSPPITIAVEEPLKVEESEDTAEILRRGRGKWVPLQTNPPSENIQTRRRTFFPTDPADARAALLAKKSIRMLSYRQQKRQRIERDQHGEEVLCVCRGHDDGRELVQCDGCLTWYHLQCIGIKNIAELGREEDPWYCEVCEAEHASTGSDDINMADVLMSEPTFAPSEDEPRDAQHFSRTSPFFHEPALDDSPVPSWSRAPRTPTRRTADPSEFGSGMSLTSMTSSSTWPESSRPGPSTPHRSAPGSSPHQEDLPYGYDESPFDPTSTPSRGIKFGASFATPKNNPWSNRGFHTPSKIGGRDPSHHLNRSSDPYETVHNTSPARPAFSYEESPSARTLEKPSRHSYGRRIMEARVLPPLAESPILKGREVINGLRRDFLPPSMFAQNMLTYDMCYCFIALVALRYKPSEQSYDAYTLDLKSLFGSTKRDSSYHPAQKGLESPWRERALALEKNVAELQAKYDSERTMDVPSVSHPLSFLLSTFTDLNQLTSILNTGPVPLAADDFLLLFATADRALEAVGTTLLSFLTLDTESAPLTKGTKRHHQQPSDVLQTLAVLLSHLIETALPLLSRSHDHLDHHTSQAHVEDQPNPIDIIINNLMRIILQPICQSFAPLSYSFLHLCLTSTNINVVGPKSDVRQELLSLVRVVLLSIGRLCSKHLILNDGTPSCFSWLCNLLALEAINELQELYGLHEPSRFQTSSATNDRHADPGDGTNFSQPNPELSLSLHQDTTTNAGGDVDGILLQGYAPNKISSGSANSNIPTSISQGGGRPNKSRTEEQLYGIPKFTDAASPNHDSRKLRVARLAKKDALWFLCALLHIVFEQPLETEPAHKIEKKKVPSSSSTTCSAPETHAQITANNYSDTEGSAKTNGTDCNNSNGALAKVPRGRDRWCDAETRMRERILTGLCDLVRQVGGPSHSLGAQGLSPSPLLPQSQPPPPPSVSSSVQVPLLTKAHEPSPHSSHPSYQNDLQLPSLTRDADGLDEGAVKGRKPAGSQSGNAKRLVGGGDTDRVGSTGGTKGSCIGIQYGEEQAQGATGRRGNADDVNGLGLDGGLKVGETTADDERPRMYSPIEMRNHIHNDTSNNSIGQAKNILNKGGSDGGDLPSSRDYGVRTTDSGDGGLGRGLGNPHSRTGFGGLRPSRASPQIQMRRREDGDKVAQGMLLVVLERYWIWASNTSTN
ncbi:hypothetical protein EYR38_001178 [Pleurotus pulmonarius]|nr:hypothetical protein EYR38_001178 [Pleurotus pulmonarius]